MVSRTCGVSVYCKWYSLGGVVVCVVRWTAVVAGRGCSGLVGVALLVATTAASSFIFASPSSHSLLRPASPLTCSNSPASFTSRSFVSIHSPVMCFDTSRVSRRREGCPCPPPSPSSPPSPPISSPLFSTSSFLAQVLLFQYYSFFSWSLYLFYYPYFFIWRNSKT